MLGSILDLTIVAPVLFLAGQRKVSWKYLAPFKTITLAGFVIEGALVLLEILLLVTLFKHFPEIIRTVKNRSYMPSGENKFATITPSTIPNITFLLNTTRWLNISGIRNWMAAYANGVIDSDTATYKGAIIPLMAIFLFSLFIFS